MSKGTAQIYISNKHPDATTCHSQLNQARRLHNTLLSLHKERTAWLKQPEKTTPIANNLGITYSPEYPKLETWTKQIHSKLNIDTNSKLRQQVRKALQENLNSIHALRKKNPGAPVSLPKYKKKLCEQRYIKQTLKGLQAKSIDDTQKYLVPTGWSVGVRLPTFIKPSQVNSLLIKPSGNGYVAHILYEKKLAPKKTVVASEKFKAGVDLGINQLATAYTTNPLVRPSTISGKPLKALNQYYNKQKAKLASQRDLATSEEEKEYYNQKINELGHKRNQQMTHYMNTATNALADWLEQSSVSIVIIGWSAGFKDNASMGKVNNQHFTTMPLARFRDGLARKLEERGLEVIIQEESYTSKANYLARDVLPVYDAANPARYKFTGYRECRSWFKVKGVRVRVHADLNGAANILRKAYPDEVMPLWLTPRGLSLNYKCKVSTGHSSNGRISSRTDVAPGSVSLLSNTQKVSF